MDDGNDSEDDPSNPHISSTYSDYRREGEHSDPLASRPTINLKRRRTTAPVLEGSSRGWGPDQTLELGPEIPGSSSYPHSLDPAQPPAGWVLETQIGEYAQENAKLHDLHTLRPRLPHSEEVAQDHGGVFGADVNMEEKVVKERYEERNKYVPYLLDPHTFGRLTIPTRLLGSLFLERQRRLETR